MLHRLREISAACTPVNDNYLIFLTEISNLQLKNYNLFPTSNNELTRMKEGMMVAALWAGGTE